MELSQSLKQIINKDICSREVYDAFLSRIEKGVLTRDENPRSHFCVYFLPYNPANQQVFITHHKKSGLWLSTGGHIDLGEDLFATLNREISEELGLFDFFKNYPEPFCLTYTPIMSDTRPCQEHYDVWHLVATDGSNFKVDPAEFYDAKWMTIEEAKKIVSSQNLEALGYLEKIMPLEV